MIAIFYDPQKDEQTNGTETKREFSLGDRIITIEQGENRFDDTTLILLEQFETFRAGEDKWFKIDRNPPKENNEAIKQEETKK